MANYRADTRDRMHDCGCHDPAPMPPFPSPVMPPSIFEDMMYRVAYAAGYLGDRNEFREDLANALNGADNNLSSMIIQKDSIDDFPSIGLENALYIDAEKKEAYFWKEDGYYKLGGMSADGEAIPPDGLTYEGGVI